MKKLITLGATCLAFAMLVSDASAQRRGGAVSGGMRGAVVGGMVGGSEGAEKGAKVGAVTGATSAAITREAQARNQYVTSTEYQNAPHSNFAETPPEVLGTTATGTAEAPKGEAVINNKDGKPVVGITFPADWKQKVGEKGVAAVSADGQAYGMIAALEAVADKQAGIEKAKKALENYMTDIKFDEPSETKGGAKIITGSGKGKKSGVDVVFACGFFESGKGQLVGATFVVDSKMEDHYKETIGGICQTIRRADDFGK